MLYLEEGADIGYFQIPSRVREYIVRLILVFIQKVQVLGVCPPSVTSLPGSRAPHSSSRRTRLRRSTAGCAPRARPTAAADHVARGARHNPHGESLRGDLGDQCAAVTVGRRGLARASNAATAATERNAGPVRGAARGACAPCQAALGQSDGCVCSWNDGRVHVIILTTQ